MKIAVVGGGVSGLAAGWRLREAGHEIVVLEAGDRTGGKIRSERADGFLVEHGPNGYLDSREAIVRLVDDLGLGDRTLEAGERANKRFIYTRGALRALPASPPAFFKSDVLPLSARLRVLFEPFVRARRDESDESAFDFAARRIGVNAAAVLVDAMVTGVYAGDSQQLSLSAAFPKMAALEREHGGLVRGMMAKRRAAKADPQTSKKRGGPAGPGGVLVSFRGGMQELTDNLSDRLGDALQTGRPVSGLEYDGGWRVLAAGGDPISADAVVLAVPAYDAARLIGSLRPAAVEPLEAIPYAAAAVVAFGLRESELVRPLDGFGFLIPGREKRRILGTLWSSSIYAERAPEGLALIRSIVGGARHPKVLDLDDDALVALVREELDAIMGPLPDPVFHRVIRWPRAIPQYNLGHLDRVAAVEQSIADLPGLHLTGNGFYGVSVAECAARADALVDAVVG